MDNIARIVGRFWKVGRLNGHPVFKQEMAAFADKDPLFFYFADAAAWNGWVVATRLTPHNDNVIAWGRKLFDEPSNLDSLVHLHIPYNSAKVCHLVKMDFSHCHNEALLTQADMTVWKLGGKCEALTKQVQDLETDQMELVSEIATLKLENVGQGDAAEIKPEDVDKGSKGSGKGGKGGNVDKGSKGSGKGGRVSRGWMERCAILLVAVP